MADGTSRRPNVIFVLTDDQAPWAAEGAAGDVEALVYELYDLTDEEIAIVGQSTQR